MKGQHKDIHSLADLTPDPKNARKHTPRNVGMIEQSLHEVGAARSIVIDENGVVLAGNATIEGAAAAGIEKVQVVDADGQTIIAVRRSGLSSEQKTKLALFDNRAAELATWDPVVLQQQHIPLGAFWTEEEFKQELAKVVTPLEQEVTPPVDFGSYDETIDTQYQCPKCHFEWSGKPK